MSSVYLPDENLKTVAGAAVYLAIFLGGCHPNTVRRYYRSGLLPGQRGQRNTLLFATEHLDALLPLLRAARQKQ